MTDAELRERFPEIDWDTPIEVTTPSGSSYHCRYCIAHEGLTGHVAAQKGRPFEQVVAHICEAHE